MAQVMSSFQTWEWLLLAAVFAAGTAVGRLVLLEKQYEVRILDALGVNIHRLLPHPMLRSRAPTRRL